MKLASIMQTQPQTISPTELLAAAHKRMLRNGYRHLPVVQDGNLCGMLTEHDILAFHARLGETTGVSPQEPVAAAMQNTVHTATPDDEAIDAARRMAELKIGCLPVVENDRVIGIVTATDLLRTHADKPVTLVNPVDLPITEFMTPFPYCVRANDFLLDAAARMLQHQVRHLPVIDAERTLVGMLSDRDIRSTIGDPMNAFEPAKTPGQKAKVSDAMSAPAISANVEQRYRDVAQIFVEHPISAVPIVDSQDQVVGIVSFIDLLQQ